MLASVAHAAGWRFAQRGALEAFVEAERERFVLWAPVFYGIGIGVYFALPWEPQGWICAAGALAAIGLAWLSRRTAVPLLLCAAVALSAAGFAVAKARTALREAPVLARETGFVTMSGRLVALETHGKTRRAILDRLAVSGLVPPETPVRVRLRLHPRDEAVLGQRVELLASLRPPPEPVIPDGYDFQRRAYFQQLGGVGFALKPGRPVAAIAPTGWWDRAGLWIGGLRRAVNARIEAAIPGEAGAVATALVTGERGAIPKAVLQDMRAAGLAHLLAISGLHLGLVYALIFGGLRLGLACIGPLALRFPIKKWAALAALFGSFGYLLLAGGTVPTQRAFIMTGVVLVAVVADRRALSMRMVACAAMIVLTLRPENLTGASFQMSFAAVTALVAAYEVLSRRRPHSGGHPMAYRLAAYLAGIALTTLIAGSATSLFALHHFGRISSYGMLANMVAIPVTALWIMPSAIVSVLAMPIGLEAVPLSVMGAGIEVVLRLAATIAAWPGAERAVPTLSAAAMVAAAGGGLWLCLWRSRIRLFGVFGPIAAVSGLLWVSPPDLLVSGDGRLIGVADGTGGLLLSSRRAGIWAARSWLERLGERTAAPWPRPGEGVAGGLVRCDLSACLYRRAGLLFALVKRAEALEEDCRHADIVIARVPVRRGCGARLVIDRFDLAAEGAHALWIGDPADIRVDTVVGRRGRRPWVAR